MTNIQNPGDFPTEQQPITEIQIGQWFHPFTNYDDVPYEETDFEDFRAKNFSVNIEKLGRIDLPLVWSRLSQEGQEGFPELIVLPFGIKIIDGADLTTEERKMETRLLFLDIETEPHKWNPNNFPYTVTVRLPDETEISLYNNEEGHEVSEGPKFYGGITKNGEEFDNVLIPEAENVLSKVQIKFGHAEVIK